MKKGIATVVGMVVCAFAVGVLAPAAGAAEKDLSNAYPLATCPVSGKALTDKAVVKEIDGREIRFCCEGCPAKFEADAAKSLAKVDEAIIADQKATYAADACPVSGQKIAQGEGVDKVVGNRLVRFCCDGCPAKYEADPAKFEAKLDEQIIDAQKASYPLETCVVSGEKLGDHGDPVDLVVGNQLVRLCCAACEKKVAQAPAKYIAEARGGASEDDKG